MVDKICDNLRPLFNNSLNMLISICFGLLINLKDYYKMLKNIIGYEFSVVTRQSFIIAQHNKENTNTQDGTIKHIKCHREQPGSVAVP